MIKVTPLSSWDLNEQATTMIKWASNGLRGNDLNSFIKVAGHQLANEVQKMNFGPGDMPIFALAMSAHERVGNNRNADTWYDKDLILDHSTFEKYARFYRNHQNKDPNKSYGLIKKSHHNDDMMRVELIITLNGTKESADRNGGLIADKELEILERGDDLPGSMSTKIAYDQCLICGNQSKTRADYCTEATCSHGGMQKNAGRVCEDGKTVCVSNHGNRLFDWSHVLRPADRTAFVFGAIKAASALVVGGAELAEMMNSTAPAELLIAEGMFSLSTDILGKIKIARDLAAIESMSSLDKRLSDMALAFDPDVRPHINDLNHIHEEDRMLALKALTQEKIALSFSEWLQLTTGEEYTKCAEVASHANVALMAVYEDLINDSDMSDMIKTASLTTRTAPMYLRKWAAEKAETHSIAKDKTKNRIWQAALGKSQPKEVKVKVKVKMGSNISPVARQLAKCYAAYQVNFLHNLENDRDFALTADLIIAQNRSSN